MVLAETVERNNISATEPANYAETVQVMEYVKTNVLGTPLSTLQVLDANASIAQGLTGEVLYTLSVVGDWCSCVDAVTGNMTIYPHLGVCTAEELASKTQNCTIRSSTSIDISHWKGTILSLTTDTNYSYPIAANHTCASYYDIYQESAGLCRKDSQTLMTSIKVVNVTNEEGYVNNTYWTFAGSFGNEGNSTTLPVENFTNTTNATHGDNVYYSSAVTGSPYNSIRVSMNGVPCLNPSKSPASTNTTANYPIFPAGEGCGYWNTSSDLYEVLDMDVEWNFFLNEDLSDNLTYFSSLYGFVNSTINENAVLYSERKLTVNDTDFCYSFVANPDAQSSISDIPNLNAIREALTIVGFIVSILGLLVFLAYLIATRASKSIPKASVGIYVFWLEHGLGCLFAVVGLVLGVLTDDLTTTIDDNNAMLNDVSDNACFVNVPRINEVYTYLSEGIANLYGYIGDYNTATIVIAIIFLVLELILLLCWLFGFQCQENLSEEDIERKQLNPNGQQRN